MEKSFIKLRNFLRKFDKKFFRNEYKLGWDGKDFNKSI